MMRSCGKYYSMISVILTNPFLGLMPLFVYSTESRSWRDLKMGIAGSSKVAATHQNRSVKKESVAPENSGADAPKNPFKEENLDSVPETGGDEPKCHDVESPMKTDEEASGEGEEGKYDESKLENAQVKFV